MEVHPEARFVFDGEVLRADALEERARRFAAGLRDAGVSRGDRVASFLGTSNDLVVALLGTYRAGAVWVPVNTRYRQREVRHILEDSGAVVALVESGSESAEVVEHIQTRNLTTVFSRGEPDFAELLVHDETLCVDTDDDDLALFIYTSGTTGTSKGVEHSYGSVTSAIGALTDLWRWTPDDTLVLSLPLFHVHGLGIGVHGTLLRGNAALLQDRFDPRAVADAIDEGGTIFMGVPTMYARLLDAMQDDPELADALRGARLFTSGSDSLRADHFQRFEALTGHRILERYGMSETMLTVSNPYEPERRKPGAIGFAVPGVEVRVVDQAFEDCAPGERGEVVVKGPFVMRGYWNQSEKTAQAFRNGWFLTGDMAWRDDEGYIHHAGRRSVDIIKSGGYKISAKEIESVLLQHTDVVQVAVVGTPDPEWGEQIAAAVVTDRDDDALFDELEAFLADRLAAYKQPRRWMRIDELPRNALGKVQKPLLVERFAHRDSDGA